LTYLCNVARY